MVEEGVEYYIEESTSDEYVKNLLFKNKGTYIVEVTLKTETLENTGELKLDIEEDKSPVVDYLIENDSYYRDSLGEAEIVIRDASYSVDNDKIATRIWTVYYDANNNGSFEEEEGVIVSSENDKEA